MRTTTPTSRRLAVAAAAVALISAACGHSSRTTITPPSNSAPATSTTWSAAPATTTPATTAPATTAPATIAPRPTAPIDQLVDVASSRMHVRCVGQGATTVLLLSGFSTGAEGWATVEPAIATRGRVCSYERPGTGTSDPANSTETFTTQATGLHALLTAVGEPGPYVVVGHSFGGAEAVTFAALFPDEVIGLVLVDASPTTWPATLCAVPDDGSDAAGMIRATCTGSFLPSGNSEHLDVAAAFAEVSRIASLGSLPMAVVTATNRVLPAGLAAPEVTRVTKAWNRGQQAWLALSSRAHLVLVDHTGHHIEIDQPGVVIDEITRLLP